MRYSTLKTNLFLLAFIALFSYANCYDFNNTKKRPDKNKHAQRVKETKKEHAPLYRPDPANPVKPSVLKLLNQTSKKIVDKNMSASIGFFSADLKYDGSSLKFCEIGNGLYGVPLPSLSIINGQAELLYTPYWDLFWPFLSQFNLPILYVGSNQTNSAQLLKEAFGGHLFGNISELEKFCKQNFPPAPNFKATKIRDHQAILAYAGARNFDKINRFKQKYPNILFVNNFDALFRREKDKIHEFFNCPELKALRPRWKAYPSKWTPTLAAQIKKNIPCPLYVIKPSNSHSALGVTLVEKEKLDETLKVLLKDKKFNQAPIFMVEEFVESKTIIVDNKTYDPTLRAAFATYCDNGKIVSTFFSCFWKIPPHNLADNVSLTKKHITASMIGCKKPGNPVNPQTMVELVNIFNAITPTMYEKMLTKLN